jgi:ABC-type glycerol-3-phosphate transport system permease component
MRYQSYTLVRTLQTGTVLIFATVLGFLYIVPVAYTLITSVKPLAMVFEFPIRWIPREIRLANYWRPLVEENFYLFFFNSFISAISVTAGAMVFGSMAGYSLAKFRYPGRDLFFIFVLLVMIVPIEVIIVPLSIVVKNLGLINTLGGLILPLFITPMSVFWMRQYLLTIPSDYCEAARVEGVGEIALFFRIILPMCLPALGALAIFSFMTNWNALMWPMVVTSSKAVRTVPVAIVNFVSEYDAIWNELFAMSVLSILPLLILFFFARERLIEGMAIGGLKG